MIEGFLIGVIATASVTAGLFFLKFWKNTRDAFFLYFSAAFFIEAANRISLLLLHKPNEGNPRIYVVRLLSLLLILLAILKKNFENRK